MESTLRHLLVQRAARLQERPALSTPEWGTLDYFQLRNRVEGVALGILAISPQQEVLFSDTHTPWDWVGEVAVACCGFRWDAGGTRLNPAVFGGPQFNDENGRQLYHDREDALTASTLFFGNLSQAELLGRLKRLNRTLGWDHTTRVDVPMAELGTAEGRGALWSALYAGAHVRMVAPGIPWEPLPFRDLFLE